MDFGAIESLIMAAVAGVVWLIRLEGRHNVLLAMFDAMKERVDGLEERILKALDRIEQKLDNKADRE